MNRKSIHKFDLKGVVLVLGDLRVCDGFIKVVIKRVTVGGGIKKISKIA